MKRIVSYGDSFTAGLGTDRKIEESIYKGFPEDKKPEARAVHREFIINNSYTKFFADKLELPFENYAEIGCSNLAILNKIYNHVIEGKITSDDFLIVGFTSSFRDKLPFFPTFERSKIKPQLSWSLKEMILLDEDITLKDHNIIHKVFSDIGPELDPRIVEKVAFHHLQFKRLFLTDLYEEYYYDFFNQNIIIQLQELFKVFEINYVLLDAFEPMILDSEYKKSHLINSEKYWGMGKQSIYTFLQQYKTNEVYEDYGYNINDLVRRHPSRLGHVYFAEELYNYFINHYKW